MCILYINPTDLAHRFKVGVTPAESPQLQGSEFSRNSKALDPSTRTTPRDGNSATSGSCVKWAWKMDHLKVGETTPGKLTWISQK